MHLKPLIRILIAILLCVGSFMSTVNGYALCSLAECQHCHPPMTHQMPDHSMGNGYHAQNDCCGVSHSSACTSDSASPFELSTVIAVFQQPTPSDSSQWSALAATNNLSDGRFRFKPSEYFKLLDHQSVIPIYLQTLAFLC